MTNTEWHAEYARLELAEMNARAAYRKARGVKKELALEVFRAAGKARWDFEMAGCVIVDTATLPPRAWLASLLPRA
jgi:hypothetical protein